MNVHVFRLLPNQDVKKELKNFVQINNIKAGVILSVVGSLSAINLRTAGGKDCLNISDAFEILSMTGTLSESGNHVHLAISDRTGKTLGGHLMDGCIVRTTAEIAIMTLKNLSFERELDDRTGYDELVVNTNDSGL
ncbi:MAG: PPC domain-containing DNA-binding protein [Alphaproteobacteria bacterium]